MVRGADQKRVIALFTAEVKDHLDIIDGEIKQGNKKDALLWLNELLTIRATWASLTKASPQIYIIDTFARDKVVLDRSESETLAKLRLKIVGAAIARAQKLLQARGWELNA